MSDFWSPYIFGLSFGYRKCNVFKKSRAWKATKLLSETIMIRHVDKAIFQTGYTVNPQTVEWIISRTLWNTKLWMAMDAILLLTLFQHAACHRVDTTVRRFAIRAEQDATHAFHQYLTQLPSARRFPGTHIKESPTWARAWSPQSQAPHPLLNCIKQPRLHLPACLGNAAKQVGPGRQRERHLME